MDDKKDDVQINASEENIKTKENTISLSEYDALKDTYTRLLAELVNTKKNASQDIQRSKKGMLLKIISIIDNYNIVISSSDESSGNEILKTLINELEILLATEGVIKADIKVDDMFNSTNQEAITMQPGDEDGKILSIVSPAYEMDGQVLKNAKVIVSKKEENNTKEN